MLPLKFCYVYTIMVWVHFMVHFPPLGNAYVTVTSAPDVRLPKSVIPIHYDIELQPYMHDPDPGRFTFKGSVRILVKCVEATDNITLHTNGLHVNTTMIRFYSDGSQTSSPQYLTYDTDFERQFFIIKLTKNMEENSLYYVEMSFWSPLQKDLRGLYYSEYTRNGQPVYLATTQFQPTHARKAFPCFDEPALKATFNVTLVRPENRISISNMPIIDSSQSFMEDGIKYVKDVFQQTPVMSTYILAFVVSDFEYTQDTTKYDVTFRAWAAPETVNQTLFSLDVGVDVMTYFEDYFKIKYPLPKEDMIAVTDFEAGAMENWGLIIYKLNAMLWEPGVSDEADKESVATVVAHELAHQWFGNLVTPSWWDDLWLNEGFATFGQYAGMDHVLPEWKMFDNFVVSALQTALEEDGKVSSHPVFVPVGYPEEIKGIFDAISYKKGASIVRMMRHFLGHETFEKAMSKYLNRKAYSVTTHDDLWQILTEQASTDGKDVDVKEIMDTWILQMNYPVVTVTRDSGDDGQLRVTQERYLEDPTATDPGKYESPFGYRWTIPLTFASSTDPDFDQDDSIVVWLWKHEESKYIDLTPARLPPQSDQKGWFIANVQQKGFYRVNYQSVNWISLCRQLQEDHKVIPVTNRAQIIDDAWNLFRAGHIGIDIALKTFDYLDNERDYVPWEAVKGELDYMLSKLSHHSVFGAFQNAMQDKLYSPYRYFGLINTGDSHTEILTRSIVASQACSYGIQDCRDSSSVLYKDWMDNPKVDPIDPDLKSFVHCNAIRNGGWSESYFFLKKFKEVDPANQDLRFLLVMAMACSEKSWILNFYLDLIFKEDSPFTVLESIVLLDAVATKSAGRPVAWSFFRANYDKLQALYGSALHVVIESVTGVLDSESELNELLAFKASGKEGLDSAEEALDQAVEKVKSNIKWLETNVPLIEQWLTDAGYA